MQKIRNVCILAHVDHGKTSIADSLVSSNGIISQRQAADIRYLDSTVDEQTRGITMKSSAVSIVHKYKNKLKDDQKEENYLINLIDSPGHVDFCGEVNMAVKLSDNSFIVVDVVEGVCSQTRTVVRQAWREGLHFVLVLNKIDKLKTELHMDTNEAYQRLSDIIETVHHIVGEMISAEVNKLEEASDTVLLSNYISDNYDTSLFHPLKGRVVFCSAYHHWGFRISDFVNVYSDMLGIDKHDLYKKMWGDYFLNSKKSIIKGATKNNRKNIFTSLILDQIWSIYDSFEANEIEVIEKKMAKLQIKVNLNHIKKDSSSGQLLNLRQTFYSWMPLHRSLLDALIEKCPDPIKVMTDKKLELLVSDDRFKLAREILRNANETPLIIYVSKIILLNMTDRESGELHNKLVGLSRVYSGFAAPNIKVFVFTARFNPYKVDSKYLESTPDNFEEGPLNLYEYDDEENEDFACALGNRTKRVDVYVIRLKELYRFVGMEPILLNQRVSVGNIIGVSGLNDCGICKNATIAGQCSLQECMGLFAQSEFVKSQENVDGDESSTAVLCVSLEPMLVVQLNELHEALLLLERSDVAVKISQTKDGQLLLYAAGEIHLQKCLTDIRTIIAPNIEFEVSDPIVPFRETVVGIKSENKSLSRILHKLLLDRAPPQDLLQQIIDDDYSVNSHTQTANQQGISNSIVSYIRLPQYTGSRLCCRISLHPLPGPLFSWINKNYTNYARYQQTRFKQKSDKTQLQELQGKLVASLKLALEKSTEEEKEEYGEDNCLDYTALLENFWGISEKLYDEHNMLFSYLGGTEWGFNSVYDGNDVDGGCNRLFWRTALRGFQRSMRAGVLCEEPVRGCVVILHNIWEETVLSNGTDNLNEYTNLESFDGALLKEEHKSVTLIDLGSETQLQEEVLCNVGQFGSVISRACHTALLSHPGIRLMICYYKLDLEVRISYYKSFSSLLSQLHGYVVSQVVNVGNFAVEARLPVATSLGFGQLLRERTSGEVGLPQLSSMEWKILDSPPFMELVYYRILSDGLGLQTVASDEENLMDTKLQQMLELKRLLKRELSSQSIDPDSLLMQLFGGRLTEELVSRVQNYINFLRKRKGLSVRMQLVEFGDKQRTLAKKK